MMLYLLLNRKSNKSGNNLNSCCVSSLQDLERPQGSEEAGEDEESESAGNEENGEERPNNDEGDGALHDSAFAIARSATAMDRRGNDHSSIKSSQGTEREGCRTAGPLELRKEPCRASRGTVFTTLHLLPKSAGEPCRPIAGTLPRLLTGQKSHSRLLAEAQTVSAIKNISNCSSLSLFHGNGTNIPVFTYQVLFPTNLFYLRECNANIIFTFTRMSWQHHRAIGLNTLFVRLCMNVRDGDIK